MPEPDYSNQELAQILLNEGFYKMEDALQDIGEHLKKRTKNDAEIDKRNEERRAKRAKERAASQDLDNRKNALLVVQGVTQVINKIASSFNRVTRIQTESLSRNIKFQELDLAATRTFSKSLTEGLSNITARELQTDRIALGFLRQSDSLDNLLIQAKLTGGDSKRTMKSLAGILAGSSESNKRQDDFFTHISSISQQGNLKLEEVTGAIEGLNKKDADVFKLLGVMPQVGEAIGILATQNRLDIDLAREGLTALFAGQQGYGNAVRLGMADTFEKVVSGRASAQEIASAVIAGAAKSEELLNSMVGGSPGTIKALTLDQFNKGQFNQLVQLKLLHRSLGDSSRATGEYNDLLNIHTADLKTVSKDYYNSSKAIRDKFDEFGTNFQSGILQFVESNGEYVRTIAGIAGAGQSVAGLGIDALQLAATLGIHKAVGGGGAVAALGAAAKGLLPIAAAIAAVGGISWVVHKVMTNSESDPTSPSGRAKEASYRVREEERRAAKQAAHTERLIKALNSIDRNTREAANNTSDSAGFLEEVDTTLKSKRTPQAGTLRREMDK